MARRFTYPRLRTSRSGTLCKYRTSQPLIHFRTAHSNYSGRLGRRYLAVLDRLRVFHRRFASHAEVARAMSVPRTTNTDRAHGSTRLLKSLRKSTFWSCVLTHPQNEEPSESLNAEEARGRLRGEEFSLGIHCSFSSLGGVSPSRPASTQTFRAGMRHPSLCWPPCTRASLALSFHLAPFRSSSDAASATGTSTSSSTSQSYWLSYSLAGTSYLPNVLAYKIQPGIVPWLLIFLAFDCNRFRKFDRKRSSLASIS